jgi:hypothetical protein
MSKKLPAVNTEVKDTYTSTALIILMNTPALFYTPTVGFIVSQTVKVGG